MAARGYELKFVSPSGRVIFCLVIDTDEIPA